jgi:hypothetical protein
MYTWKHISHNATNCAQQTETNKYFIWESPVFLYLEMEVVDCSKSPKAIVAQPEIGVVSFCRHMKGQ